MIAAHPDDERTPVLAYFARGRHMRTAYLSATRGEGGQNLIGSEQGAQLGIIRTQELLAARRIDGAQQFFTRAIDFGFTRTPEETLQKWGREKLLSDMVWVIRSFRPDVIILCFTGTPRDGHGQHQASAIVGKEASGSPTTAPYASNTAHVNTSVVKPQQGNSNTCVALTGLAGACNLPSDFAANYGLDGLYNRGANGSGRTLAIVTLAAVDPGAPEYFWSNIATHPEHRPHVHRAEHRRRPGRAERRLRLGRDGPGPGAVGGAGARRERDRLPGA